MSISPPSAKRRKFGNARTSTSNSPALAPPSSSGSPLSLTVYAWNVNGITPFVQRTITEWFASSNNRSNREDSSTPSRLRQFLRRHAWPELLFLQEVKINPDDAATIRAVENAVHAPSHSATDSSGEPDYIAKFCLPVDKFNARGFGRKIYGVCSIIRKDFYDSYVERVRPVEWDNEGRFLIVETKSGLNTPKLAIINIYAVNGTDSPYKDPIVGSIVGNRHDRKLAVHSLLARECRTLQDADYAVILAGDMNVARTRLDGKPNLRTFPAQHCLNRADFEAKFFSTGKKDDNPPGLGMIDTFRMLHPTQRGYTYHPYTKNFGDTCDRVDMILVSASLQHSIRDAGMHETPQERGPSDHVPLFARLEFDHNASEPDRQDDSNKNPQGR